MARTKESAIEVAVLQARTALKRGKSVCVFGLLTKNMDDFLRGLPEKKVQIIHDTNKNPRRNTGIVLIPRSIHHKDSKRLIEEEKFNVFNRALQPSGIKRVLMACKDLLGPEDKNEHVEKPSAVCDVEPPTTPARVTELIRSLIVQMRHEHPEDVSCSESERVFAVAFKNLADEYDGGVIPSRQVVELIDTHKAGGIIHLVKCGWIAGVVLEGKQRITAYRATTFLVSAAQRRNEDSLEEMERARRLINEEPALLEQLRNITEKLQLIQELKRHLNEMHNAMKGA